MLKASTIKFGTIDEVVKHAEIIFVAVQTPHDVRYEGITRIPEDRKVRALFRLALTPLPPLLPWDSLKYS